MPNHQFSWLLVTGQLPMLTKYFVLYSYYLKHINTEGNTGKYEKLLLKSN